MKLLRACGAAICLLACSYFAYFAYRTLATHDLKTYWESTMIFAIVGAGITYLSIVPITSWAWHRMLESLGCTASLLSLNAILGTTQIAKYVPGNIAQHLGRLGLALQRGIQPQPLFVSVTAELLLATAASGLVGATSLALFLILHEGSLSSHVPLIGTATMLALVSVAALALTTRLAPQVAKRLFPGRVATRFPLPAGRAMLQAFLAYSLTYTLIGAGFYFIAWSTIQLNPLWIPLFIAAFSLSWLAGFVAPGAPAGLGVREGTMTVLLSPFLDRDVTLTAVVAFRIASTLGDLFGLAWGSLAAIRDQAQRSTGADLSGKDT